MSVSVILPDEIVLQIDGVARLMGRTRAWCVADAVRKYADFAEKDWQTWDTQIEQDSAAGKLDSLAAKAVGAASRPI